MISLWRTEWLKLRRLRPFWVVFWLYPLSLGGLLSIALWAESKAVSMAKSVGQALPGDLPFAFPTVWQSVAYLASWLHLIPALLLVLHVTNEFTFRSHRQNLLDGWSRWQFLLAKLLVALSLSLFCTLTCLVMAVIGGLSTGSQPGLQGISYLGLFLLQLMVYQAFALLCAFIIRRGTLALAAFSLYAMMLENIAGFFLNRWLPGYGSYLPLELAGGLLPIPYLWENAPEAAQALLSGPPWHVVFAGSLLYLGLLVTLIWLRFRREDL